MISNPRVMLLIDADNVSADVMEQALEKVQAEHGAVHVRRAYCTAEAALQHLKLFKALSIRPIVNVSTGKNCTDIALAVDAIDLVLAERPDVVVVVSSDSDFAPLVIRLREKGCRVQGIGQEGKTGEASKGVYDAFIDLPPRRPDVGQTRPRAPAKRATTRRKAPPRAPALPEEVEKILLAIPALRDGLELALNSVAEALREHGLVAKNASSTKFLRKHPDYFVLSPQKQPHRVRYRAPNGA